MKNNWFTYIKLNEKDNKVKTSGIKFEEFINGVNEKPNNILILEGHPSNTETNFELWLDYIKNSDLEEFYKEDVYSFGDFHWIDFDNEDRLNNMEKLEFAKLLYFNHKAEPIDTFLFKSLNNKYAYFAHDDDYIVNVYIKNIEEYKNVINYKILKELKGRKRHIENIPDDILDYIYELCKSGIVIDFEKACYSSVNIYTIGNIGYIDEAHGKLDLYRKKLRGISLSYDNRKKTWTIL